MSDTLQLRMGEALTSSSCTNTPPTSALRLFHPCTLILISVGKLLHTRVLSLDERYIMKDLVRRSAAAAAA